MTRVAETFHVLPHVAARAIDEDPENLALECLTLLSYAKTKEVFDDAKDEKDTTCKGRMMERVKENTFALSQERRDVHVQERSQRRNRGRRNA